jgi:hypothetical protein
LSAIVASLKSPLLFAEGSFPAFVYCGVSEIPLFFLKQELFYGNLFVVLYKRDFGVQLLNSKDFLFQSFQSQGLFNFYCKWERRILVGLQISVANDELKFIYF